MDLLSQHGIKFKVIAVVSERTLADPEAFFNFFYEWREYMRGFHFNIIADGTAAADPDLCYSQSDKSKFHTFYRELMDLCRRKSEVGDNFQIQNFTQGLNRILKTDKDQDVSFMEEGSAPLKSLSIDARGNVTTFYAGLSPETLANHYGDDQGLGLGNILEAGLGDMVCSSKLQRMIEDFAVSRKACRKGCDYFLVCPGGYELTKLTKFGQFDATETPECIVQVKALTDAILDEVSDHLASQEGADVSRMVAGIV